MGIHQLSVFSGAFRYEFRMQVRRRALWIVLGFIALLISGIFLRSITFAAQQTHQDLMSMILHTPTLNDVVYWTSIVNILLPIGVGVMIADRFPRDQRTHVDELFTSMPGTLSARIVGKYLGATVASIVPMFVFYGIGVGVIVYATHDFMAIPLSLATFAVVCLPGLLFVSAYSLACPAVLWVPLYQFLFVGYWFWGNLLSPHQMIPTLNGTILTPMGQYASKGFFGVDSFRSYGVTSSALQGVESIGVLLVLAMVAVAGLWGFLKLRQARM